MKVNRAGDIAAVVLPVLLTVCAIGAGPVAAQQLPPDAAALQVLDSARRAHNEGKFSFAADRFRDFLRQYGGHHEAPAAHYGLALSLLELPQRDISAIISELQQVTGRPDFADRAFALYHLGSVQRGLGGEALEQIAAKPNEAGNLRSTAARHFEDALKNFTAADEALAARIKAAPNAGGAADPPELEWLARARCDRADVLLRLGKHKEAGDLAAAVLADKALAKSRFRSLALYHQGYALFALKDYLAAGRALSQLAPFQQEFGVHARYLLGRTHHLSDELPEAAAQYKALVAEYEQRKKAASESLKNPGSLRTDDRLRLETLVKGPAPDYVLRAWLYSAVLTAENGRYGDAAEALTALIQQHSRWPMAEEAQLRLGYCYLQSGNFAEAVKALQPLQNHPQLADRALWWSARATAAAADPNNAQGYEQAVRSAVDMLNRAADRAGELAKSEPEAKVRRGDILLELADTQQLGRQYKEAVGTYQKLLAENNNPDRVAEALQRLVTALHLSGQYKASDEVCQQFEQQYPHSVLLPAVWFRAGENARLTALLAAAEPNARDKRPEIDRLFEKAIQRYQWVLKKYPEFGGVNLTRYGLASCYYQMGQYAEALSVLSAIPAASRSGDLAGVAYLMADCHIRAFPPETDDALQAAQLLDQAEQAARLLEGFLAAQNQGPQAADALLKLGYCHQRIGAILADPVERQKSLTQAKETYERVQQQFSGTLAQPPAVFERAKCLALLGDGNGAVSELNRFQSDPLKNSPVAPLAMIRLASLLRAQNKAADAVKVAAQARSQYEASLLKEPERIAWAAMLQYEHALAVKESGKPAEARTMFEAMAKQFAGRSEAANAQWRAGQCRREELAAATRDARNALARPGVKLEQIAAATKTIEESLVGFRQTAQFFQTEASNLAKTSAGSEAHLRMLYESAWCWRALAEAEIEAARQKMQREALEKVLANLRKNAPNQPAPQLNPPEIALADVPLQPAEKAARDQYAALVAAAVRDVPLAARARLELAEVYAQRKGHDAALELLSAALEATPPPDLAERVRLQSAATLLAKGDPKAALLQIQAVARNAKSSLPGETRYLAGEAYIQLKDWGNAIDQLQPFRDNDPFRNMSELCERALLRLGYACAEAQKWDDSRRSYEQLVQRFPQSPWVYEARYGIGWSWQNQNQHDNAVNAYNEVVRGTAAEVAARAQLQIGLCRLAQKRYPDAAKDLLVVATTYDCAEHSAAALCEAGQAHLAQNQPAEAARLWQQVLKDHAASKWAAVARQRLADMK